MNNNLNILDFKNHIYKELRNYNHKNDGILSIQFMNNDNFTKKESYKTIEYLYKFSISQSKNIFIFYYSEM